MQRIARGLTTEFGKGFDATNLRFMRQFYPGFPIRDALRRELIWTRCRRQSFPGQCLGILQNFRQSLAN